MESKGKTTVDGWYEFGIIGKNTGGIHQMFHELFKKSYHHLETLLVCFTTRAMVCKLDESVNILESQSLCLEHFLVSRDIVEHTSQRHTILADSLEQNVINAVHLDYLNRGIARRNREDEQQMQLNLKTVIREKITSSNNYCSLIANLFSVSKVANNRFIKSVDAHIYLDCLIKVLNEDGQDTAKGKVDTIVSTECGAWKSQGLRKTFVGHLVSNETAMSSFKTLILKQTEFSSCASIIKYYRDFMQEFGDSQIEHISQSCLRVMKKLAKLSSEIDELMNNIATDYISKLTKNKAKDEAYGEYSSELKGLHSQMNGLSAMLKGRYQEVEHQLRLSQRGVKMGAARLLYLSMRGSSGKESILSLLGIKHDERKFQQALTCFNVSEKDKKQLLDGFIEEYGSSIQGSVGIYYEQVSSELYQSLKNVFSNAMLQDGAGVEVDSHSSLMAKVNQKLGPKNNLQELYGREYRQKVDGLVRIEQVDPPVLRVESITDSAFLAKLKNQNMQLERMEKSPSSHSYNKFVPDILNKGKQCRAQNCQTKAGIFSPLHTCRACWTGKFCDKHSKKDERLGSYICTGCLSNLTFNNFELIIEQRRDRQIDPIDLHE